MEIDFAHLYSSAGEESACNAGDAGPIPGLGRSLGKEIGYPLQYSWVSLVTQMVKNPPAMCDTWVLSLGWEDPLEEGMESLWTEELVGSSPQGRRGRHD